MRASRGTKTTHRAAPTLTLLRSDCEIEPNHHPDAGTVPVTAATSWRYDDRGWTRDLRIDFLRGFVFLLLFTAHFEFYSWFALVGWERIGVVSSAEVFILLAGVVTGAVYGKKLKSGGFSPTIVKLAQRAWTLYKVAFAVAAIVALLRLAPWIDTTALTTFTDPATGRVYPLFPELEQHHWAIQFFHMLYLVATPHQFQIIGLYVILFLLTPLVFLAIARGYVRYVLLASWALWLLNWFMPEAEPGTAQIRFTWLQFEYAFPSIAWQLLFVHGIVFGYYKKRVIAFFDGGAGRALLWACVLLSIGFMLFSLNHPLDKLPDWAVMEFIPGDTYLALYHAYFQKYKLGPGRLLNLALLMIALYALLTVAWRPICRALGWLFIPLGQDSMYVFFVHVFLILLVANSGLPQLGNVWINTALHVGALLLCWAMVKTRFLFRWIPH